MIPTGETVLCLSLYDFSFLITDGCSGLASEWLVLVRHSQQPRFSGSYRRGPHREPASESEIEYVIRSLICEIIVTFRSPSGTM